MEFLTVYVSLRLTGDQYSVARLSPELENWKNIQHSLSSSKHEMCENWVYRGNLNMFVSGCLVLFAQEVKKSITHTNDP